MKLKKSINNVKMYKIMILEHESNKKPNIMSNVI